MVTREASEAPEAALEKKVGAHFEDHLWRRNALRRAMRAGRDGHKMFRARTLLAWRRGAAADSLTGLRAAINAVQATPARRPAPSSVLRMAFPVDYDRSAAGVGESGKPFLYRLC